MNWQYGKILKIISEFIGFFVIMFGVLYVIFNFSSVFSKIKYKLFRSEKINIEIIEKELDLEKNIKEIKIENTLIIPRLNINVPIVFSEKEESIKEDLQSGASHHPSTSKPGQSGNILISGHSSNYFWEKGDYNSVFTNLSDLQNNDKIFVYYENTRYDYEVFENKILNIDQANKDIFREEGKSILNLITCWPVGTAWKRLIIKANLN